MTNPVPTSSPALGICLEEYEYPYPVQFYPITSDLQALKMAYMDIPPGKEPNGKTVVLFHRKAFGGYYFHNVIEALTGSGYRVVAPDQIGWGKLPKPDIHYSFQLLAANTAALLDQLGVPTELLDAPRPPGSIVEGEHFLVTHAPLKSAGAGTVIAQARRHLLDFGEMTPTESAEFGTLLHRLVPAVKAATGVDRVYFLALMERAAHFHLWLIPERKKGISEVWPTWPNSPHLPRR